MMDARFLATKCRHVKAGQSPLWLVQRQDEAGGRDLVRTRESYSQLRAQYLCGVGAGIHDNDFFKAIK